MKRFFSRVGRFIWSWRTLKVVLWLITLVVLFYVEEDWRGAREWAATKKRWEAQGETFDFARLIPPPVPPEQNLGALPLFKRETGTQGYLEPLNLQRALRQIPEKIGVPFAVLAKPETGEGTDLSKLHLAVATTYVQAFKKPPGPLSPLAQMDVLYPFIQELRTTAAQRRYCRFEQKYRLDRPDGLSIGLITDQIMVSKVLAIHGILALEAGQPDVALGDIRTMLQISRGLSEQSILVSGVVSIGVESLALRVVDEGLIRHEWTDNQMAELERNLGAIDFLFAYQQTLRGEMELSLPAFEQFRFTLTRMKANEAGSSKSSLLDQVPPWPDGWIDMLKARVTDNRLRAVRFVDVKARMVHVDQAEAVYAEAKKPDSSHSMWEIFVHEAAGPLHSVIEQFAQTQVMLDEARLACALERYRLAHDSYPTTLATLAPDYIATVPHDVMSGESYLYHLQPTGGYLLYSVGWNQHDDGGKTVSKGDPPRRDYEQGDWPWATPPPPKAAP